ncbi:unnamed protein product [Cuscuta epithymum]|uniref:Reverse transcriptase domain-containing protein n=1 Tax=Cuscuta epithymum TaxID=186058 RepID=A0AAV0GGW8_9ASTE|nr:unnamed protein product [Cuscuta epithymum]
MKGLLHKIISKNQSAFILKRSIVDNIITVFEVQHYPKRKAHGRDGYVALKLDMSKASDRVEWPFIRLMMTRLGFDERCVNMIMECVSTVKYSLQINGKHSGPIAPTRGIRKGDPLSPYLFIIIMEGLNELIQAKEASAEVQGVRVAKNVPIISHLLFADDSFLFFRAREHECYVMKDIVTSCAQFSGQLVNFEK